MKASDINPGDRYLIAVVIPPGPCTPRMRATKAATVVAVERSTVTVEVSELVCVNRHEVPDDEGIPYAQFVAGRLRYERQAVRREVRAADILGPVDVDVEAVAG